MNSTRTKLVLGVGTALALGALFPALALAPAELSLTKSDSPDPVVEGGRTSSARELRRRQRQCRERERDADAKNEFCSGRVDSLPPCCQGHVAGFDRNAIS